MRKLIVAAATAALLAGGANAAMANPYNGVGPGPGNSGDRALYGLCKAYEKNADQAKANSPVFNEYDADEWADLCGGVRPGGSRNDGAGPPQR